jgi:hypothetical protein
MRVHEDGKNYDVLFFCGLTVSPYKLTNNDKYPNIVEDERSTLQRLGGMHADVLLAPLFRSGRQGRAAESGRSKSLCRSRRTWPARLGDEKRL